MSTFLEAAGCSSLLRSRPKRLVIVTPFAGVVGRLRPYLQRLVSKGVETWLLAPDYDARTEAEALSLGVQVASYPLVRASVNLFGDLRTLLYLRDLMRHMRPDAVFCINPKPNIYGTIAAWWAGVPRRYIEITGLGYGFVSDTGVKRRLIRLALTALYGIAVRLATKIMFQNNDDFKDLTMWTRFNPAKATIIGGRGVDLTEFRMLPPEIKPVTFTLMGRLLRDKGVVEFAEAARIVKKRNREVRFLLVGGVDENPVGITEREIKEWVEEGILEWPGRVDNVIDYLADTSVFVLPSYYREGLPRATQEAMALGRPVITTDAPGCRETVVPGVNGFLVKPRDPYGLAEAMQRFIDDPSLIVTMGRESRRIAEERFDAAKQAERLIEELGLGDTNYG